MSDQINVITKDLEGVLEKFERSFSSYNGDVQKLTTF